MQSGASEKKSEWQEKGKNVMERGISEVKSLSPEEVRRGAAELTSRIRDASVEAYGSAVGYVRRNPVSSALGLCALGFLAGLVAGRSRRQG